MVNPDVEYITNIVAAFIAIIFLLAGLFAVFKRRR